MSVTRASILSVAAAIAVLLLFEVSVDIEFSLPGEEMQPDLAQEALFAECYEKQDTEIHRIAFGTIDNPDVQKEFINTNRERAIDDCRGSFPVTEISVSTPLRFSLLRFKPRFW